MPALNPFARRLGLALFRLHIENGIAVAIGILAVGAAFYFAFGLSVTVLAYTGALCASIVDQPGRFSIKPPIFLGVVVMTSAISLLAALAGGSPILLGALVAALSFVTALISAYGRRALGLGVAGVLALVLGISGQKTNFAVALQNTELFAAGGIAYAIYALLAAALLDGRTRRVVLGEALRSFANYLHAKAAMFDPFEMHKPTFRAVIEANGVLSESLQNARDMIYAGRMTRRRARYAAALTALVDTFEQILSCDSDIQILRKSSHRHLLRRMRGLIEAIASDIEVLIIQLSSPRAKISVGDHTPELRAISSEISRIAKSAAADVDEEIERAAFQSTNTKFVRSITQLARLTELIGAHDKQFPPKADLDIASFMQQETISPHVLLAQFSIRSPTMRYAIRLTCAMTAGYAITLLFPNYVHGSWILLTTALIMRANYSITRQRRNDRVVGTLLGCIIAAALIHVLPGVWPLVVIVLAAGASHAFGTVNYRVTALGASISALLLLHFMYPASHPLLLERVVDTLIGAALASAFSFLLPSWERRNVPQLIRNLLEADRIFVEQALHRAPIERVYRLSRRNALDAITALSSATRRLLDEPGADRRHMATINQLLGANYLFAADLASVRTALLARAKEFDPAEADEVLQAARSIALESLSLGQTTRKERPDHLRRRGMSELSATKALPFLRRRLLHIERGARNVAALAARVIG
jgi:uncharacterized membrane protein YccC